MTTTQTMSPADNLLATVMANDTFRPFEPLSFSDVGLPVSLIESLILKRLSVAGINSGRQLADYICIPFNIVEPIYQSLRSRQMIVHQGSAPLNDYQYALTQDGRGAAENAMNASSYIGPAPVPLEEYVTSVDAQSIRYESPRRKELLAAFRQISIDESLFEALGPAVNSGAGLFLYGEPGNGKSTLAQRITACFGQEIWVPHAIYEDGQIMKIFDAAYHKSAQEEDLRLLGNTATDKRWVRIRRPTVMVGGELTLDALEIRHDPASNISEAPLQVKSNCGCLVIDDFGRQQVEPGDLLNRWIVPLENRIDFLTLSTGKKIQMPFEQLIIFSTNLEPSDLVDDAFLRRIPYKIEIGDPTPPEFHHLFKLYCDRFDCEYRKEVIDGLISQHYVGANRPMRRCHPRDLLNQIRNYCVYNELKMELRPDYLDRVVKSYFTVVK